MSVQNAANQWNNMYRTPSVHSMKSWASQLSNRVSRSRFRPVVNNKGQNGEKRCATKQKETEEQLLKRDYKKALLTDMKSQIESIW